MAVVIETTMGCLTVDLYVKERPITCNNFLKLCKMKYYNFSLFHCVQSNFIAQTGDPTGTGNGGESIFGMIHGEEAKYYEAEAMPKIKHARAGLISMVNCGNNMLGSQFFFTLGADLHSLDGEHCVFGEVTEGTEVLIQLNEVICDEKHHPFRDIRITHTVVLEDPFDDPPNLVFPDRSPEPTKERLMNGRIAPDEEVDDTKGKTMEEVEEMVQKREAQARATILEIVGDIPDADVAPPENVLFVCKLNPVTTDEDLEIIFGRFGTIKSCEVIRDKSTGDSLQYAFIEFEDKKACENAYFKMDNVLIDDRRIHVDFSQSVAKIRWRGKGKGVDYFPDASQRDSQSRIYKDSDFSRMEQKERKDRRSRSRSPHSQKNQEDRNSENWEKYERKDKHRDSSSRHYRKSKDSSNGRIRSYDDRSKGVESRGQRNSERGKDWNNDYSYKWDGRGRFDGKDYNHHGRSYAMERMEMESSRSREKRHRDFERSEKRDGDADEKYRTSKERYSKVDKRMEDLERLSSRGERGNKDDSESRKMHGESSRYDERKGEHKDSSRGRKDRVEQEGNRGGPDVSSENEGRSTSRGRKRRTENEKERVISSENSRKSSQSNRSDESRSVRHVKNNSDDQSSSKVSVREVANKGKMIDRRNSVDGNDTDTSNKYEMQQSVKHSSKHSQDLKGKKGPEKKTLKRSSSDGTRQSWSSEKMKRKMTSANEGRKASQKRKKYSSSSSCCSDSSCSCVSSCCSSSSDSDDSDDESNSDYSESSSSSSSSPDRKVSAKRKKNKKKVHAETKKNKGRKSGHKRRHRTSSESSTKSFDEEQKVKRKHRKRKADDSSSSEQKPQSRSKKVKKKRKKSLKRKSESSESSSEESSSSSPSSSSSVNSYAHKKVNAAKRKKLKKGVTAKKKVRAKRNKLMKHKGKKGNSVVSSKKKRKRNYYYQSESSDSSGESESESSQEEVKHKKETSKGKSMDQLRSR